MEILRTSSSQILVFPDLRRCPDRFAGRVCLDSCNREAGHPFISEVGPVLALTIVPPEIGCSGALRFSRQRKRPERFIVGMSRNGVFAAPQKLARTLLS